MMYLLLSILGNTLIFIVLKYFGRFQVNTLQAIVVNYVCAFSLGLLSNSGTLGLRHIPQMNWFGVVLILGILFIIVFLLLAKTAQDLGVSVATVANKMSVVIPVAVAVLYYHNTLGFYKIAGIGIALAAVVLSSKKEKTAGQLPLKSGIAFLLPAVVFIGSGVIDAFVNYGQEKLVAPSDSGLFLAGCFGVAGCIGITVVSLRLLSGKDRFDPKCIPGGIALAIPNYASIYCMLKALNSHVMQSSVLYPLNNMGIVLLCAAGSFLLFKERFSKLNLIGIALSVLAIALISFA